MTLATIAKYITNLFYPLHCPACKKPLSPASGLPVCTACATEIRRTPRPYCASCGKPVDAEGRICEDCAASPRQFDRAYAACLYEGSLKELIHGFKFGATLPLEKFLSSLMIDFLRDNDDVIRDVDLITFVPLHTKRARDRGFNQSQLLAREVAVAFDAGVTDTLIRSARRRHQNMLSRAERLTNLTGAFTAREQIELTGRTVLLIDDVMTTGSTLNECARVLKDAGAAEVRCLTLARGA